MQRHRNSCADLFADSALSGRMVCEMGDETETDFATERVSIRPADSAIPALRRRRSVGAVFVKPHAVASKSMHCFGCAQAYLEEALALRRSVLHPLSLRVNEATKAAMQVGKCV